MAIKIIPEGDADLESAIAALEAAWAAGATGVTIQRELPAVIEMSVITSGADNVSCRDCDVILCSIECQNGRRGRRIAELQQQYSEQEKALEDTAAQLREVIHADH